jgi:ribosomal protein L40E
MLRLATTTTVAKKPCRGCSAGLNKSDQFCRRCGVAQADDSPTVDIAEYRALFETTQLRTVVRVDQPFLILSRNGGTKTVASKTETLQLNRIGVFVVGLLIAFPIWLLIIALSPLDAYASAKATSSRMRLLNNETRLENADDN